jgi:transposase
MYFRIHGLIKIVFISLILFALSPLKIYAETKSMDEEVQQIVKQKEKEGFICKSISSRIVICRCPLEKELKTWRGC